MRTNALVCGIAKVWVRCLDAAQKVVGVVVGHVRAPVQQENTTIGFGVKLVPCLGGVRPPIEPIIDEVAHVYAPLVLKDHVVQDAARVHYVSYLKDVEAWQRNFENAEAFFEHAKDALNGFPHRLAPAQGIH